MLDVKDVRDVMSVNGVVNVRTVQVLEIVKVDVMYTQLIYIEYTLLNRIDEIGVYFV